MITQEQREQRREYVGSSDIAAILDFYHPRPEAEGGRRDPYRNARDIYESKVGPVVKEDDGGLTDALMLGNCLEEGLVRFALWKLGKSDHECNFDAQFKRGVLLAHTDCYASDPDVGSDDDLIIEAKRVGDPRMLAQYGRAGTDQIPESTFLQIQHQLHCSRVSLAYAVADRVGKNIPEGCGCGVGIYKIARDEQLGQIIERSAERFMREHVQAKHPPVDYVDDHREAV